MGMPFLMPSNIIPAWHQHNTGTATIRSSAIVTDVVCPLTTWDGHMCPMGRYFYFRRELYRKKKKRKTRAEKWKPCKCTCGGKQCHKKTGKDIGYNPCELIFFKAKQKHLLQWADNKCKNKVKPASAKKIAKAGTSEPAEENLCAFFVIRNIFALLKPDQIHCNKRKEGTHR